MNLGVDGLRQRLAETAGDQHEHLVNGVIEITFEEERKDACVLHGRLRSVHVFRTIEACRRFVKEFRPNALGIYLVEHDGERVHDSYMEWVNRTRLDPAANLPRQLDELRRDARAYWRSESPPKTHLDLYEETLLSEHVRVVRRLE